MKKIFLTVLASFSLSASADLIPNQWGFDTEADFSIFSLINPQGNKIELSCENTVDGKKGTGHGYRFYKNENDSISQITFKIDGKNFTPANYAQEGKKATWNGFIKALVKGKKIEVLMGKKKIATFNVKDRGAIADIVNECVL